MKSWPNKLKSQTAKTIALRNDLMAKMHSNAVLTEKLDQMNGEAINKANEIANLKADLDAANAASKLFERSGAAVLESVAGIEARSCRLEKQTQ